MDGVEDAMAETSTDDAVDSSGGLAVESTDFFKREITELCYSILVNASIHGLRVDSCSVHPDKEAWCKLVDVTDKHTHVAVIPPAGSSILDKIVESNVYANCSLVRD